MSVLESTEAAQEAAQAPPAPPEPFLTGTFSAYQYQETIVIAWRKKNEDKDRHLKLPKYALQAAAAQTGVSADEVISYLIGLTE